LSVRIVRERGNYSKTPMVSKRFAKNVEALGLLRKKKRLKKKEGGK